MRELKFRVWNGGSMENNVVVGRFGVFYVNPGEKGDGLNSKDSSSLTPFNTIYSDMIHVMQFTGLLDKNGVEIYEGDIVRAIYDGETTTIVGEVKFNTTDIGSCGCCYDNFSGSGFATFPERGYIQLADPENVEVIGNTYQNPELLP